MNTVTYEFNDGSTNEVPVSEELYQIIIELEIQEQRNNRRETRRHISLDYLLENGIDFGNDDDDMTVVVANQERNTKIQNAIAKLLPKQQYIVQAVFFDGKSYQQVAKELGVVKSAISNSMVRILSKLKKLLSKP